MRKAVFVIFVAIGLLLGMASPVHAARPSADVTFIMDTGSYSDVLTQETRVANLWTKSTSVDVRLGSCAAGTAGCIKVSVADWPCGSGALGCAYGWDYATGCAVEIRTGVLDWSRQYDLPDYEFNVFGHEVGHCLIGSTWHDTSSERSIMYPNLHYGDRARRVTSPVKELIAMRFP